MHQQVAAQGSRRQVVDAAGAVRDVAHHDGFGARAEALDDVAQRRGEHEQALGHLQRHAPRPRAADPVDRLGDLERVVGRQQRDGRLQVCVLEQLGRHLVEQPRRPSGLGDCVTS